MTINTRWPRQVV